MVEDEPELAATLARVLAAARAAWPTVRLEEDAFLRALRARLPAEGDRRAALETLHAADLYLACACAAGDRVALAELERRYFSQIGDYLARLGGDGAFVDEVAQSLRQKLLVGEGGEAGKIAGYGGHGPLGGWLRIAAVRTALNLKRGAAAGVGEPSAERAADGPDQEQAAAKEESQRALREALSDSLGALTPEDRNLLRLHHLDGLTLDQLAKLLETPRSTLARRLAKLRETVMASTRAELAARLRMTSGELDSLIGLAVSRFDLTLSRFVK